MRLPNGFGSVVKQSGNRRRPYAVRKTLGWEYDAAKDKMVQKVVTIGYAKTKAEGIQMLSEYNKNPFDPTEKRTFSDVYKMWSEEKYKTISDRTAHWYTTAYNSCSHLYKMDFRELKLSDLQYTIDNCDKNYPVMSQIKTLFRQMYAYAMSHELASKDYSGYVNILKHKDKNPNRRSRGRFTKDDIDLLWGHKDDPNYQIILMLIYNGVRISEFLGLLKENVHLDEQYFDVIQSKTENGIRKVPIANKTLPFYRSWMTKDASCKTLIHKPNGNPFKYLNYMQSYFVLPLTQIGIPDDRTPHWTRHTCASMMADANIAPTIQKMILGHSGAMTLTERVYTHMDVNVLIDAINQI